MLGLAFASVIIALSKAGRPISGCSLNPAISFGPAPVQVMGKGNNDPIIFWKQLIYFSIYIFSY